MTDSKTQARPREAGWFPRALDWVRGFAIAIAAGVFMAVSGAFTSTDSPLTDRLVYWIVLMFTGSLLGSLIARPVFDSPWFAARPWLACMTVAGLLTVPLTLIVWAITNLVFDGAWAFRHILYGAPTVAMISVVMTVINYLADRRPRETHAGPAGSPPPRFLDRIPPKLKGAELYAVEAEDHYLRIHTERGSDLILMRLSDAVSELEGIEGAQTHRSWWVAKDAVVDVERGDGRATFILKDGARAPVSRSFARALRAEGWY